MLAQAPIPRAEMTDENPRLNIVNLTASQEGCRAVAQTAALRAHPPPRAGDKDAAEGSQRLRRFPGGLDTDGDSSNCRH